MIVPVCIRIITSWEISFAVKRSIIVIFVFLSLGMGSYPAFAHKTITAGQYEIEVGWKDEPPIVGQQNAIIFSINQDEGNGVQSGVPNAFKNLEATIKSGSVSKQLDILSDIKVGNYYAKIIPTKTGSLTIEMMGTVNVVPVDEQVTIEDVESINLLAFPPSSSSSGQDDLAVKNALSALQRDVSDIKSKIASTSDGTSAEFGKSYDFGIFGMAIGTAGVILAVVCMIKRK